MAWLKAGLLTTLITAALIVVAVMLLSVTRQGVEPMGLLLVLAAGLPAAILATAPVCLVVLPIANAILDRRGAPLFRDMTIVGAVAGALVPLVAVFKLHIRPPGMFGTVTGLLVLAGVVAGAAAGLFFAEIVARDDTS